MFRKMRRFKQELPKEECIGILIEEKRGVLSVIGDGGYPYGVPIDFFFDKDGGKLYFHSAKVGHKIDAITSCDKVCFTVWRPERLSEDGWSWYAASVIAMGRAELVDDTQKTLSALRKLGLKYYPDKDGVEREIEKDSARVQIIEMSIEHLTGKRVHEK